MAEIKDVYSLEFNSGQFQSEIDSAIARIEELNGAMAEGADVADELAAAQGSLVDILGTEAKGVEQLNQKRNVLVGTQKNLNKETQSSVAVGKQLDTTNKQLAVSTGQAATQQRNFGGQLLQGARNINSLRRAGMMLGSVFRLLGGLNPFGLLLTAIPAVIQAINGATNAQNTFNEAAEAAIDNYAKEKVALDDLFSSLTDVNVKGDERSAVIDQINQQYGDYLPNLLTEASTAEEVAAAYELVNQALIKKAVTQAKTQALEEATAKLLKGQITSLKEIEEMEKIVQKQKESGQKPSKNALARIEQERKAINTYKEQYQESLKTINEASKDLEKTLGVTSENIGKRQVKNVRKTQKDLKDTYAKIQKERDDFNKMLLREEREQRDEQKQDYLIEEKVFLDDLNKQYEDYLEEKRLADERALEESLQNAEKFFKNIYVVLQR
jgi:hypothetical protein